MTPYHATAITADGRRLEDCIYATDAAAAELAMFGHAALGGEPPAYLSVRRATPLVTARGTAPANDPDAVTQPASLLTTAGRLSDSALAALADAHAHARRAASQPVDPIEALAAWAARLVALALCVVGSITGNVRSVAALYSHHRRGGRGPWWAARAAVGPLWQDIVDPVRVVR